MRAGTRSIGATPPTARRRQHVQMDAPHLRCFGDGDPLYERYHDEEWGFPVRGDVALYERITLEAFQSGLSWITILRKREGFRRAFAGFDPTVVAPTARRRRAAHGRRVDRAQPGQDRRSDRERRRAAGAAGARAVADGLVWRTPGRAERGGRDAAGLPARRRRSRRRSRALRREGYRFVGADDRLRVDAGLPASSTTTSRAVRCALGSRRRARPPRAETARARGALHVQLHVRRRGACG